MAFSDAGKKSFDFASDYTKQCITLSTAILTLTITFRKDVLNQAGSNHGQELLTVAWIGYVLTILFALVTLGSLAGNLTSNAGDNDSPSIQDPWITLPGITMALLFFLSTGAIMVYGIKNV